MDAAGRDKCHMSVRVRVCVVSPSAKHEERWLINMFGVQADRTRGSLGPHRNIGEWRICRQGASDDGRRGKGSSLNDLQWTRFALALRVAASRRLPRWDVR